MDWHTQIENLEQGLVVEKRSIQEPELARIVIEKTTQLSDEGASNFIKAGIALCRKLNYLARPLDALPIAKACTLLGSRQNDKRLEYLSLMAEGIVNCYSGNLSTSLSAYKKAFDVDCVNKKDERSIWLNVGNVFKNAAVPDLAIECYGRVIEIGDGEINHFFHYAGLGNLAQCHLLTGNLSLGLEAITTALSYENATLTADTAYSAVVLRNNYVRLLVASGNVDLAKKIAADAIGISKLNPCLLMGCLIESIRSAVDLGLGNYDIATTRLLRELERVRMLPECRGDVLLSLIQAEKMAGNGAKAVFYLKELTDSYSKNIVYQARQNLGLHTVFHDTWLSEEFDNVVSFDAENTSFECKQEWHMLEQIALRANLMLYGDTQHSARVGKLSELLAIESGYDSNYARQIGFATLVHNVGAIGLPSMLLSKKNSISFEEKMLVHKHRIEGNEVLLGTSHPRAQLAKVIADFYSCEWNGGPNTIGVSGISIPRVARIVAVANAFDVSLMKSRDHDNPLEIACSTIKKQIGTALEPDLTHAFLASANNGRIKNYLAESEWELLLKRNPWFF